MIEAIMGGIRHDAIPRQQGQPPRIGKSVEAVFARKRHLP
jgi:hypothetical protein